MRGRAQEASIAVPERERDTGRERERVRDASFVNDPKRDHDLGLGID